MQINDEKNILFLYSSANDAYKCKSVNRSGDTKVSKNVHLSIQTNPKNKSFGHIIRSIKTSHHQISVKCLRNSIFYVFLYPRFNRLYNSLLFLI